MIAAHFNSLNRTEARGAFEKCCAAKAWVDEMIGQLPFESDDQLLAAARHAADSLGEEDWLEAFDAHPMIGDVDSLRERFASTKSLAAGEQAGVGGASESVLSELARLNQQYLADFGFIFIVYASGKSANDMLDLLRVRLGNSRQEELLIAGAEQMKITELRLRKAAE